MGTGLDEREKGLPWPRGARWPVPPKKEGEQDDDNKGKGKPVKKPEPKND